MYVRTKDGAIYDLKSKEISSIEQKDCWVNIFYYNREKGQYLEWDDNGGRSMDTIYKTEILKQSDNLEELCDEFVYIKDGIASQYLTIDFKFKRDDEFCALRNKLTANGIAEISKGISKYELENGELKFAIWTDKGLIYVSKMNDKGELELI